MHNACMIGAAADAGKSALASAMLAHSPNCSKSRPLPSISCASICSAGATSKVVAGTAATARSSSSSAADARAAMAGPALAFMVAQYSIELKCSNFDVFSGIHERQAGCVYKIALCSPRQGGHAAAHFRLRSQHAPTLNTYYAFMKARA